MYLIIHQKDTTDVLGERDPIFTLPNSKIEITVTFPPFNALSPLLFTGQASGFTVVNMKKYYNN